jgi:hypothetical protein
MKPLYFLIICLLFFFTCKSQPSDILILKKNSRSLQTFFPGSAIKFFSASSYYDGYVTSIYKDSVFIIQYDVRQIPTTLGVYILDTVGVYNFGVNYKDIIGFGKDRNKKFSWAGSGGALLGGGTLLTVVGLGTWIFTKPYTRYYASPYLIGASAILAGIGYILTKSNGKGILLGKKYSLEYINVK